MKTTNDGRTPVPRHLDDADLISYLDGELSRDEQEYARTHLESCWNCRSKLLAMQNSIENFLRVRKQVLPPEIPPSGAAVAQFRWRLFQHASVPVTLRLRLTTWLNSARWRELLPDFSPLLRYRKAALATAFTVVVLMVVLVDPLHWNRVSADELMARADAYEFLHESPSGRVARATVVIQKINLETNTEKQLGHIETDDDSLSSAVHLETELASGVVYKMTVHDRDKLSGLGVFSGDFDPATAGYLNAQSWFPRVTVSSYRRLIADRGFKGNDGAFITQEGETYQLHHPFVNKHASGITETVLLLNARNYAPRGVSIFTKHGDEQFEYRLTRKSFELVERTPEVAQLFTASETLARSAETPVSTDNRAITDAAKTETATVTPPAVASAELEVEVLRLLSEVGADLGEQVEVARTNEGRLRVTGLVETEQRKAEILRALSSVSSNPVVRLDVQTVAEAVARQKQTGSERSTTIEGMEVAADTFPAYADLRRTMSDEEARVFAARVVSRSHAAMRHAWALKRLMGQFSREVLRTLPPEAHAKWISLIKNHARAFERESASLRQQLQPVFGVGGGASATGEITNDAELIRAVGQLVDLASSNYEVVRSAFTITNQSASTSAIRTPQFWQSLRTAEGIAAKIQN